MSLPKFTQEHHTTTYASISPLLPSLSTAGKVVLITGGGSGIGPTIAHSFARSGTTKVILLGRTILTLNSTAATLEAEFPSLKVLTHVADIVDENAVNSAFISAFKQFGKIDILVSNAGYMSDLEPLATGSIAEWWKGMEINLKGNIILTQAFLRHASPTPVFIALSTAGAHLPAIPGGFSSYSVSKLALVKMMEYLQLENPEVRVLTVHPGVLLQTNMGTKAVEAGLVLPPDDCELCSFLMGYREKRRVMAD